MPATPVHHTATDDSAWDGPNAEKSLKLPLTTEVGDHAYAWQDPDGDPTTKAGWKFIHHFVSNAGLPGSASTLACSTGIGVLNGARVGTTIPDADRKGVYAHLVAHLADAGVKEENLPELKSVDELLEERDGTGDVTETKPIETFNTVRACREALYGGEFRSETRGASEVRTVRQMDPSARIAPQFEMREVPNGTGGTSIRFTGYASVVERGYDVSDAFGPYEETISRNAFKKTLSDGADVSFLVNHTGITMARTKSGTLQLSSDSTGLYTEATLNMSRPDVQIVRAAVEDGDLDEMSFAFRATRQEWNEDYTKREIQEVNLNQGDVSVVNYGANPATGGTVALRSKLAEIDVTSEAFLGALIELRAGAAISAANMKTLSTVLDLVQGADTNVDHALVVLSNLMGVKNPDIAQDAAMDKSDPSKNSAPTTSDGNGDGESDPPPASRSIVLPDHTQEARARLAAIRNRRTA